MSFKNASISLITALILLSSCSQKAEQPPEELIKSQKEIIIEKARQKSELREDKSRNRKKAVPGSFVPMAKGAANALFSQEGLGKAFYLPFESAKERLLEYSISMTYSCADIQNARRQLLLITSQYGYIKNVNSSANDNGSYLNAHIRIKSDYLYDALSGFDNLGKLVSENLSTTDFTETMYLSKAKHDRELAKFQATDIRAGRTAYSDKISSLEHEQWRIKDRIAWAEVHVQLRGPRVVKSQYPHVNIQVPPYQTGFINILNIFMKLVYTFIWWLPYILLAGLALFAINKIRKAILQKALPPDKESLNASDRPLENRDNQPE